MTKSTVQRFGAVSRLNSRHCCLDKTTTTTTTMTNATINQQHTKQLRAFFREPRGGSQIRAAARGLRCNRLLWHV
eukprot:SAG11_NODE_5711_length_1481_cov_1.559334_1_plen_74_part_10